MSYASSSERAQITSEQAPAAALSEFGFTALRTIAAHAEQIQQMEHQLTLQRERIRELERELAWPGGPCSTPRTQGGPGFCLVDTPLCDRPD